MIEIHNLTIVFRAVFYENKKCYPQVFLDECLYKLKMLHYRIDVSEELDANKKMKKESAIFVTIGVF